MCRPTLAMLASLLLLVSFSSADEPKGPFARGEKIRGDLSDLLDADADGAVTDGEAQKAAQEFAKRAEKDDDLLAALDKNKDGRVAEMEAQDAVAEMRAEQDQAGKFVADIFRKLDANGDKLITGLEFQQSDAFGPLGALIKPRIAKMLVGYDRNRDSMISFTEAQMVADNFAAQAGMKRKQEAAAADAQVITKARSVFAALDGNRNGKISIREAKKDPALDSVFALVDADGDRNATLAEVVAYLKANP